MFYFSDSSSPCAELVVVNVHCDFTEEGEVTHFSSHLLLKAAKRFVDTAETFANTASSSEQKGGLPRMMKCGLGHLVRCERRGVYDI